jgi:thiamine biosynthesis protein ThiS
MQIFIDGRKKSLQHTGQIANLLKKLKIRREEVVVKINGKLAPETIDVREKDKVEIIKVIFGG